MSCKYCELFEPYIDITDIDLLEVFINKQSKSLEVHFCNKFTVLDYDQIKINYCPFCGNELTTSQ
jgi:hypothetical protein